ncbi:MAG TPA: Tol-Pal system protein TolB, partial [Allosphingosinicella sp.]|nr:Tol-Pal system protein TolB [Allosphingosinicella sp.]
MTRIALFLFAFVSVLAPGLLLAQSPAQPSPPAEPGTLSVDVTAEGSADLVIAVPALATPQAAATAAGPTDALGKQIADVIVTDLRGSGLFRPIGPGAVRTILYPEVQAPDYAYWPGTGAAALVQGFVRANPDGKLTIGCYLYDVALKQELTRQGFILAPADWRRAAHKCADAIYARLSGESPFFDSRIAYIAETGPKDRRVKRLAIMDSDGANHRFLTNGQSVVLTPRFSPDYKRIVYLSYIQKRPRIYIYDIGTGRQHIVTESANQTFAPRFSPDGRFILYSMAVGGNTDIYRVSVNGGASTRLTNSPTIDVGGSYSPDG